MTQPTTFATLVASLARQAGVPLDAAPGMVVLELNGVSFMLAHDPAAWGEDTVMLACDFGPVPEYNRSAILEALLSANGAMLGVGSPVFTYDPDARRALSMLALPLAGLDPARTMQAMMQYVAVVTRWQQDYFLAVAPA